MPTDAVDHLQSFLALTVVGVILTAAFSAYTNSLTQSSEAIKLRDILHQVAAKATAALETLTEDNATVNVVLSLPLKIGNKDYWIRISNDSSYAWVEGGFGSPFTESEQDFRVYLPKNALASGTFEGEYQLAQISCVMNGSTPQLTLGRKE
ncbi:hypothetical protein KEJ18_06050 [Candidatus Bathyarchaeota archaeon]|nr:hypothetical protein [Candidatus Bathyarchaeota archaeon]